MKINPTGIPKRIPSILSSTPPCPGKIFPVFFKKDFLFRYEKKRSPSCTLKETIKPNNKFINKLVSNNKFSKKELIKIDNINDPILPEIVLFGLIFVSFGPLKIFPKVIPPMSDAMHVSSIT